MGLFQNVTNALRLFNKNEVYDLDQFVEKFLLQSTEWDRARLYDAISKRQTGLLLHARQSIEPFIVDTADKFMSREVFITGSSQFDTVRTAFDLISRERGADLSDATLIDVGANIGVISIPTIARGLCARAIAIEPTPSTCRLLRANVALNGLESQFTIYQVALSDREGEALFELSDDNTGDNRLSIDAVDNAYNEASRSKIRVPLKRFDNLLPGIDATICVIWIDVQGFEGFVLAGASAVLKSKPPLVLEFWPYGMRRTKSFPLLMKALDGYDRYCVLFSTLGVETAVFRPTADLNNLWESVAPLADEPTQTLDILVL